jgi:choline-glycine betaine transporter
LNELNKNRQNIEKLKALVNKIGLLALLFNLVFVAPSCKSLKRTKAEKQLRIQKKNEQKRKKVGEKEYKRDLKAHQNIQNKQTRKRMKTMRKKGERKRKNAKPNFLTRWFRNR